MGSHDDRDSPSVDAFRDRLWKDIAAKAKEMTEQGLNRITAGMPGEEELFAAHVGRIHVKQLPRDVLALRISIGRAHCLDETAETEPAYLVFRGDPQEITTLLERALAAMKAAF